MFLVFGISFPSASQDTKGKSAPIIFLPSVNSIRLPLINSKYFAILIDPNYWLARALYLTVYTDLTTALKAHSVVFLLQDQFTQLKRLFLAGCEWKLQKIFFHCTPHSRAKPLNSNRILISSFNCFVPLSSTELESHIPKAPVIKDCGRGGCSCNPGLIRFVMLLGMPAAKQQRRKDRQTSWERLLKSGTKPEGISRL